MKTTGIIGRIRKFLSGGDAAAGNTGFLQPDDLDEAVLSAVRREGRKVGGVLDAPVAYEVFIAPEDYDAYFGHRSTMICRHLEEMVASYVEGCGGIAGAAPTVALQIDGSLGVGRCRVEGSFASVCLAETPVPGAYDALDKTPSGAAPISSDSSSEVEDDFFATPSLYTGYPGADEKQGFRSRGSEAQLKTSDCSYEVHPGNTIGVIRDGSRDLLPDVQLDLGKNRFAHQVHGRFDCDENDGRWSFTCLGTNGVFVLKAKGLAEGKKSEMLKIGGKIDLDDGDVIEIPDGQAFVFCEE